MSTHCLSLRCLSSRFLPTLQGDVKKLMDDVVAFKPTLFIAVPRILERVADTVEGKLAKAPAATRAIFKAAFAYKLFLLQKGFSHHTSGLGVDTLVFAKIKQALVSALSTKKNRAEGAQVLCVHAA